MRKIELLTKLRHFGYFLIDAVDYPIDDLPEGKERNDHVRKNFPILLEKSRIRPIMTPSGWTPKVLSIIATPK